MKFVTLLSAALLLSMTDAFAPTSRIAKPAVVLQAQNDEEDAAILSRRQALFQGATTALSVSVAASTLAPQAALADIYDEQEKERKLKAKQNAENGKKLVPAILGGGLLLSVPFFFPNLVRLAKKTASLGEDDGYGS